MEFWCCVSISSENTMKRESGANPGQTRCCKLNQNPCAILKSTGPFPPLRGGSGGAGKVAQRTSKSEDLPKYRCFIAFGDWSLKDKYALQPFFFIWVTQFAKTRQTCVNSTFKPHFPKAEFSVSPSPQESTLDTGLLPLG